MIELVVAAALLSQPAAEEFVVPTEMCRGFWLLPVTFGDSAEDDEARTLWFLHDTGASTTVVDPDSLERVFDRRFEEDQRVNLIDGRAGPLQVNRLPVRTFDIDHLSAALGREIDGLMSVHALDDFLLILDYPAQEMRLRRGRLPRPDGETIFSTRGPDRRPWIRVDFAGREQRLLIDSGAAGTHFAVNDIDQFQLAAPAEEIKAAVRFDRLEPRRVGQLDGNASFAGVSFQTPVLEEVPRSALLGGEALRHFVVTLDQQNRRVQMDAATDAVIPFEPYYEFGAVTRPTRAGFEVLRLYDGLPFSQAGIEVGDLVTHFNDRPAGARGCDPLEAGSMTLTVQRDGETLELEAEIFPVFDVTD